MKANTSSLESSVLVMALLCNTKHTVKKHRVPFHEVHQIRGLGWEAFRSFVMCCFIQQDRTRPVQVNASLISSRCCFIHQDCGDSPAISLSDLRTLSDSDLAMELTSALRR